MIDKNNSLIARMQLVGIDITQIESLIGFEYKGNIDQLINRDGSIQVEYLLNEDNKDNIISYAIEKCHNTEVGGSIRKLTEWYTRKLKIYIDDKLCNISDDIAKCADKSVINRIRVLRNYYRNRDNIPELILKGLEDRMQYIEGWHIDGIGAVGDTDIQFIEFNGYEVHMYTSLDNYIHGDKIKGLIGEDRVKGSYFIGVTDGNGKSVIGIEEKDSLRVNIWKQAKLISYIGYNDNNGDCVEYISSLEICDNSVIMGIREKEEIGSEGMEMYFGGIYMGSILDTYGNNRIYITPDDGDLDKRRFKNSNGLIVTAGSGYYDIVHKVKKGRPSTC